MREWDNSIFVYNKDAGTLVPHISNLAIKFIKNYFSLYNLKIEKKLRKKNIYNKHRKLSSNKIYLSKGEFKHTNNKVIITLYTFNRQKSNYILKLKNFFSKKISYKANKNLKKFLYRKRYFKNKTFNNLLEYSMLKDRNWNYYDFSKKIPTKDNFVKIKNKIKINKTKLLIKKINNIKYKSLLAIKRASYKRKYIITILDKLYKLKKIKIVSRHTKRMLNYIKIFYKWRIKKYLKKMNKYIYYKQLIYINKSKFNYTYLQYLKNYLQKLFNKNVEFNFINLKKFYLNSNMLSESVFLKIKRKRSLLLQYINGLKKKIKIRKKSLFLKKSMYYNIKSKKDLKKHVIKNLNYKHITGFRLEAKGRLSKKHKAVRSLSKLKYKGNLLNINSSFRNLSSVLLKGNLDSNLQYTKLKGKTVIGSFGLKGWVNGD